jgi:hypothetical protein
MVVYATRLITAHVDVAGQLSPKGRSLMTGWLPSAKIGFETGVTHLRLHPLRLYGLNKTVTMFYADNEQRFLTDSLTRLNESGLPYAVVWKIIAARFDDFDIEYHLVFNSREDAALAALWLNLFQEDWLMVDDLENWLNEV